MRRATDELALNAIKDNNIPTLIIHSKMDKKCPYYMGEELFEAISHYNKELVTFNYSHHLGAFWDENEKYQKVIWKFIDHYTYLHKYNGQVLNAHNDKLLK